MDDQQGESSKKRSVNERIQSEEESGASLSWKQVKADAFALLKSATQDMLIVEQNTSGSHEELLAYLSGDEGMTRTMSMLDKIEEATEKFGTYQETHQLPKKPKRELPQWKKTILTFLNEYYYPYIHPQSDG